MDYAVTLTLRDRDAVAEFLELLAEQLRDGAIEAISLEMSSDGAARASVRFVNAPPSTMTQHRADTEDTQPGKRRR